MTQEFIFTTIKYVHFHFIFASRSPYTPTLVFKNNSTEIAWTVPLLPLTYIIVIMRMIIVIFELDLDIPYNHGISEMDLEEGEFICDRCLRMMRMVCHGWDYICLRWDWS